MMTVRALLFVLLASAALWARAQTAANAAPASAESKAAEQAETKSARPAVVLLLPAQSTPFARAADAVRAGFFAAHEVAGKPVDVQVAELDENPAQMLAALEAARKRGVQLAVGPLTRTLVNALTERGAYGASILPMVTLNIPDQDVLLPETVLAMSLSTELEARRVVRAAVGSFLKLPPQASITPRVIVLVGQGALDRRVAAAFRGELAEANELAESIDLSPGSAGLGVLRAKLATLDLDKFQAVFLAMDARAAALVRPLLPRHLPVFGTSQLLIGEINAAAFANELEGLRFADVPWLVEPDHSAVMVYARPQDGLTTDMQRLYALGIDAYRVAMERLQGRAEFTLDGVTGQLQVDRRRSAFVERAPTFAVFRNGKVEVTGAVPK